MLRPVWKFLAAVLVLLAATTAPSLAAEYHKIAYSERLGVTVFAEMAGATWCNDNVVLKIEADDRAFFEGSDLSKLLPKLGRVITTECPQAVATLITGTEAASGEAVYHGQAIAGAQWAPVAVAKEELETVREALMAPPPPRADSPPNLPGVKTPGSEPVRQDVSKAVGKAAPTTEEIRNSAKDANFRDLLYLFVARNPGVLEQRHSFERYGKMYYCDEYKRLANNEFKFEGFLDEVKNDLVAGAANPPAYFRVVTKREIGKYDFSRGVFPFSSFPKWLRYDEPKPGWYACPYDDPGKLPASVFIENRFRGLITELPVSQAKAENLVSRGRNARTVFSEMIFSVERIADPTYRRDQGRYAEEDFFGTTFTVVPREIRVYADKNKKDLIATFSDEDLSPLLTVAAEREAKQALEAKRQAEEQERRKAELLTAQRKAVAETADRNRQTSSNKTPEISLSSLTEKQGSDDLVFPLIIGAIALAGVGGGVFVSRRRRNGREDTVPTKPTVEQPAPDLTEDPAAAKEWAEKLAPQLLGETKTCPACLSEIPRQATACRSCGKNDLDDPAIQEEALRSELAKRLKFYKEVPVYELPNGGWLVGARHEENQANVFMIIDNYGVGSGKNWGRPSVDRIRQMDSSLAQFGVVSEQPSAIAAGVGRSHISDTVATPQAQATAQQPGSGGTIVGVFGCVFGILGMIVWGIFFVPLGAITSLVALVIGIRGGGGTAIGLGVLGLVLSFFGLITTPTLLMLLGLGMMF